MRRALLVCAWLMFLASPSLAQSTTYHLHKEPGSAPYQMKTASPDAAAFAFQSADLKNVSTGSTVAIQTFATPVGVPGVSGVYPSGTSFGIFLWARKTANWGVLKAKATLLVNNTQLLCGSTAFFELTTTVQNWTLTCVTQQAVTITATDRLYLQAAVYVATTPANHSVKAELDVEGISSPVYDSTITAPAPTPPAPSVSTLTPTSGPVGTSVTIAGSNFGATQGTSTVTFNGVASTPTSWSATSIAAPVPTTAVTGPVVVTVSGQVSNGVTFTVPPPAITGLTPATGAVGTPVTIAGSGFGPSQAASTVTFNGITASISGWSPTSIIAVAPAAAITGPVVVTVNARASNGVTFTIPPPAISDLTPNAGPTGASIAINGSGFGPLQASNVVTFNGAPAVVSNWTPTSLTAIVPAEATTGPVIVTVNGRSSTGVTYSIVTTGVMMGTVTRLGTGAPLSGASIQLLLNGVSQATTSSAADGTYTVADLTPGAYDVRVTKTGLSSELRTDVSVVAAQTATVDVAMSAPGAVTGQVTDTDGPTALSGASVTVFDGPTDIGHGSTDGVGHYTVSNLHPGTYLIQIAYVGYQTKEQSTTITDGGTTTLDVSLVTAPVGPVTYAYDELNRLASVVDASGASATYNYDAVGNILSIERHGAGTVTISEFTPNSGPAAQTVTIYGAGFSTTTTENTVRFNGTNAAVTAATATSLVATVPAGATTGVISVTTPTGSAVSTASFTVTADTGMPTITGFSPTLTSAGMTVTVNGTHFDPSPGNDVVTINLTSVQPVTATATQLQAAVPTPVTTGRVSVQTAFGTATSTGYLWVPPPGYASTDVDSTGMLTLNGSNAIAMSTAGKIVIRAFEAVAGQSISFSISGGTAGLTAFSLYSPYGGLLATGSYTAAGFVDSEILPYTGTYTFVMDPVTSQTGSATVTVNHYTDVTGVLPTDGTPVIVTTTQPGQSARFIFAGAVGEHFTALLSNVTITGCQTWDLQLLAPDGTLLTRTMPCGGTQAFLDGGILPAPGTYTLVFGGMTTQSGSATIRAYKFGDITASISPGDPAGTHTTTDPGQDVRLTFTGTAGQLVSALATGITTTTTFPSNCEWNLEILQPNGERIAWDHTCGGTGIYVNTTALPVSGQYTLFLSSNVAATGSATVRLLNVVHVTNAIAAGDPAASYTTTSPGQDVRLTFTGTAGQMVSALATNIATTAAIPSTCEWDLAVEKPDGSWLTSNHVCAGGTSIFLNTVTLPTSGQYTLLLSGTATAVGSATLRLYDVQHVTGTITPGDPPRLVTTDTPGQQARLTFSATSGQRVSALATNVSVTEIVPSNCQTWFLQILSPTGGIVTSLAPCNGSSVFSDAVTLSTAGDYTLLWGGNNRTGVGTATLTLYGVPADDTKTATINGAAVSIALSAPGQNGVVNFACTAGQPVTAHLASNTLNTVRVWLYDANGVALASVLSGSASFALGPQTPTTTGTCQVKLDASDVVTGSALVNITNP